MNKNHLTKRTNIQEEVMKHVKRSTHVILALATSLCGQPSYAGYQVGTKFADVIMEYVQPGKVYNLRTMRNLPYRINNHSDQPVDLSVQVQIPLAKDLKPGYEAIPDPSWVRLVPDHFKLAIGEEGLADVILQVPDDERYRGHHYQAHILCQSNESPLATGHTGLVFGVTLQSRLRFSVASAGPEQVREMKKKG